MKKISNRITHKIIPGEINTYKLKLLDYRSLQFR